jgi:hypothetical protein
MRSEIRIVSRSRPENSNHHLWNNNGTWWCHFTVHLSDHTKKRVRRSRATGSLEVARQLRDQLPTETATGQYVV